ncbi:MAG: hypothetical protein ABJB12_01970 [Pseudomonadota bacterium]
MRRPSRCDLEPCLRSRAGSTWSQVSSTTALVCVSLLGAGGASAAGADQPAPVREKVSEFKLACSRSFEQSQRLRNGSQYVAASDEAAKCANPKCGEALFDECSKIYDQLQTALPSVVFGVRDDSGGELTRVIVTMDGQPSRNLLDGKPVSVDPGSHRFAFASDGYQRAEQAVLIRAGEQLRPINAVLRRATNGQVAPPSDEESPRSVPLASYVLGAVSVVGLGAFVGFRMAGASRFDALDRECKPTCTQSAVDNARQKYMISDVALGVSLAAVAAAVTVYLVSLSERRSVAALQVSPSEHGLNASIVAPF